MEFSTVIKILLLLATIQSEVLSARNNMHKSPGYDCTCGEIFNKPRDKITGGKITIPNAYPWQALVIPLFFMCGGSVINDWYILTAGHCVVRISEKNVIVHLGVHNLNNPHPKRHQKYKVKKIILHEKYREYKDKDEDNATYDIALLKLKRRIIFNDFIKPICLSNRNVKIEGKKATVIGWGSTRSDGNNDSEYLREAQLEVYSRKKCLNNSNTDDTMICTSSYKQDHCNGDSGGPLFYKNYKGRAFQIGIVSHGGYCGTGDHPSYCASVQFFLDWIQKHTKSARYCKNEL